MFEQALKSIIQKLEEAQGKGWVEKFALIGGFAVSVWGIPRATLDIDFALALGSSDPDNLAQFLDAEFHPGDIEDPLVGVYHLKISTDSYDIPVQLVLFPSKLSSVILANTVYLKVFDCDVPVASWQSLILLKMYAGGPQDLLDAKNLVLRKQSTTKEIQEITQLADQLGLSEILNTILQKDR